MNSNDIVIVAAKRTPIGLFLGDLSSFTAVGLACEAHKAALAQSHLDPSQVDTVYTGCALPAGQRQAPARQAAIQANIPYATGATLVNKVCGSGMQAIIFGHDAIKAGTHRIVLAGGMESMSNAPYLLPTHRRGGRAGHHAIHDHIHFDGLEDAYGKHHLMGYFAEETAKKFNFSREEQNKYVIQTMTRALEAQKNARFVPEIAPITLADKKSTRILSTDQGPQAEKIEKTPLLKPSFSTDGTITAASSGAIADGAASLILMSAHMAQDLKIKPLAKIVAHASHAQEPQWFTTAPAPAIQNVLNTANWKKSDVDLYEINEAFAVVAMAAIEELALDQSIVNVHGGSCALGHPIGASGARILVTLIYALQQRKKNRGIAAICIGGGEALAMAIEVY